jgi:hypothetical protein
MTGIKTLAKASLDRTSLGNLLVREGLLDQNELTELLAEFWDLNTDEHFGQFLVRKGILSKEKLELTLIRQSATRSGGAKRRHVEQAMEVARKTSQRIMQDLDGMLDFLDGPVTEPGAGAGRDSRG